MIPIFAVRAFMRSSNCSRVLERGPVEDGITQFWGLRAILCNPARLASPGHDLVVAPEPTWLLPESAVSALITHSTRVLTAVNVVKMLSHGIGDTPRGGSDCDNL
jgi:hypothetical protein